jgi:hypothetical protein
MHSPQYAGLESRCFGTYNYILCGNFPGLMHYIHMHLAYLAYRRYLSAAVSAITLLAAARITPEQIIV